MSRYDFLGRGLHFPVEAELATGRLLNADEEKSITESIRIILMTKKGERIMRPDFGCDIWQHLFDVVDLTALSMMEEAVKEALIKWEPRIRDILVHAERADSDLNAVMLTVGYRVRTTNNPYNLVFPYYLEEGIGV